MSRTSGREGYRFRHHLKLALEEYDAAIRRFIPGYEEMLRRAAREVLKGAPRRVLDLGAGTGALARELLRRSDTVVVEALDLDPEMLALARSRLREWSDRVRYREGSFDAELPHADAITASLALHHLPTLEAKRAVFRRIHRALPPGGLFANADVTMPPGHPERGAAYQSWAQHLGLHGIPVGAAFGHFREWSAEDTYLPVEEELSALESVGFRARVVWHDRVSTLVLAEKTLP